MSRIKVDRITDKAGTGAPILVNGMNVTGKSTMGDIVGAAVTFNSITGGSANFSSDVSIGGTLTYEDVKNVDSVGLITARNGINVTGGNLTVDTNTFHVDATNNRVLIGRTTTNTSYPLSVEADGNAENILVIGRPSDDISEIGFFENDTTTRLGELQYRQDHVNFRHRVGDIRFAAGGSSERLRIGSAGQIGIAGANYGTSGQVLTSQGGSAAPQWATPGGGSWEVASTTVLAGSTSEIIYNGWDTDVQQYKVSWNGLYTASNMYVRMQYYFDTTAGNAGTLQTSGSGYFTTSDINDFGSSPSNTGSTAGDYVQISASSQKSYAAGEMTFNMKLNVADGQAHYAWGFVASGEQGGFLRNRYNYHDDKFRTGVKIYFINNSGIVSPTRGRVTWYKLKYS